jgi:flagellar biosynthesis chaperone FliJ
MSEETVMSIDYAERYDDDVLTQGSEGVVFEMRDELIAAIDELRSTIAAQHDTVSESVARLEKAAQRIAELESQLSEAQLFVEVRLAAIRRLDTIIAAHRTNEQAQADKIIELEALVEVQGNRIRTALAENANLAERVK